MISLDTKRSAIIRREWIGNLSEKYTLDSVATIELIKYQANEMVYASNSHSKQFAVFSEIINRLSKSRKDIYAEATAEIMEIVTDL